MAWLWFLTYPVCWHSFFVCFISLNSCIAQNSQECWNIAFSCLHMLHSYQPQVLTYGTRVWPIGPPFLKAIHHGMTCLWFIDISCLLAQFLCVFHFSQLLHCTKQPRVLKHCLLLSPLVAFLSTTGIDLWDKSLAYRPTISEVYTSWHDMLVIYWHFLFVGTVETSLRVSFHSILASHKPSRVLKHYMAL